MPRRAVIELLDFVQTRGLPTAAVRARIALDVVERDASGASAASAPRVTIASVQIDESGRAYAPDVASHGHLATLLWEILAGRSAESDELPWSDPADDLPAGVLDIFASLTLRPAKDLAELRRRFAAGIRSHAASHDDVVRSLAGRELFGAPPQTPERITLRAPAVQIEALRTLSAGEQASIEAGIVTRVCPVVTLPLVEQPQVDEPPRSTLDPWAAPPVRNEITETAAAVAVEAEMPRRRRTWPVVAACLAAALVVIGLASRQRIASATSPAAQSTAIDAPAPRPVDAPARVSAAATSSASAEPAAPAPVATTVASASASQTPTIMKLPPRVAPRVQGTPLVRPSAPQPIEQAPRDAEVAPFTAPVEAPAPAEPTPVE